MKQKTNKIQKNERLYTSINYDDYEKKNADNLAKKIILNNIRYELQSNLYKSITEIKQDIDFNDCYIVLRINKKMKNFNSMTLRQLELIQLLIK